MPIDEKAAYASMSWQRFNKEISDELARAVVSAFALVAVADGDLAKSEIESFVKLIYQQEDVLSSLNFQRYEPLFRDICGAIVSDPESGQKQALSLIQVVKGDAAQSELVISAAQIALQADDRELAAESRAMLLIQNTLGMD